MVKTSGGLKTQKTIYTLLVIFAFSFISKTAFSQGEVLTAKQANSLKIRIQTEKSDTAKFTILVKLAWYQILKPKSVKTDLDSGKNYLSQAITYLNRSLSNDE